MPIAIVDIPSTPTRVLTLKEAALYCRIPVKKFPAICPVIPFDMGSGLRVYDIQDIDRWIDSLKKDDQSADDDNIVARVG